jgi:hypothetical protein
MGARQGTAQRPGRVNISAYMAALDIWDLDRAAKHAVQVIAGRANRYTGIARVSIPRVAADMKVTYLTARQALERAVDAGYLTVDKSPGRTSTWQLTPLLANGVTPLISEGDPVSHLRGPRYSLSGEGVFGEEQRESVPSYAGKPARNAPGEKRPRGPYDHFPDWTGAADERLRQETDREQLDR